MTYHYCRGFEVWTWDPITRFPRDPNKQVVGSYLQTSQPYLFKAMVHNYSDVEVRGVNVVFYWASFGLFDRGTPIGAVAVDLPPDTSQLVSSPWSFVLGDADSSSVCLSVRIFHPCDTELGNNHCWRNLCIVALPWPWEFYVTPFVADFTTLEGRLTLKVEAPLGIRASVVPKLLPRREVKSMEGIKTIDALDIKRGVPQDLALVIENVGAEFARGDTFEVTVSAMHNEREVSSFTSLFRVGETR
ncbi:MAG: hypothetical protein JSW54_02000 [Fidelibacterota bacterium]|nr:MAG: hypothetical protein JSW54_02000 [Candidatus Neomarinimicrobiota bacterium]